MDTTDDFDFVKDNARLSTLPRQAEWEAYVARFQGCDPSMTSTQKWHLMEKISSWSTNDGEYVSGQRVILSNSEIQR